MTAAAAPVADGVSRLARIEMVSGAPDRLADFYQAAFGFQPTGQNYGRADLRLGDQEVALVGMEPQGKSYPGDVAGWNPLFQHIAIIVSDMAGAYAQLCATAGWSAISTCGPQPLPAASGGVTAFKFRDPEGHPLELLAFAPNAIPAQWQKSSDHLCLGIDHSAISVSNTPASIAFYQSLGLIRAGGSVNVGPEQARLDNVPRAVVEVTALAPPRSTPHVELLCYRGDFNRHVSPNAANDVAATRLVFTVDTRNALDALATRHEKHFVAEPASSKPNIRRVMLRDPDGHLLCLESPEA